MRVPLALILIAVVVAAGAFVADHPGQVDITWQGWEIETSVGVLAGAVVVVLLVLGSIGGVLRRIWRLPANFARRRRERRRRSGYAALAGGFAAIAAGDASEAQRSARRAAALLDGAPLTLALSAQAAQLEGDEAAARRLQTEMLERPETALLALRGLYTEAMRAGDEAAALDLAERARRLRPQLPWAVEGVLGLQLRAGRWIEARDTLADAAHRQIVPAERVRRHRSAILVEMSRTAERNGERRHATSYAAQAVTLTPDRAAPAIREAEALIALGRTRAAGKAIERAWRTAPHPELARLYEGLNPTDPPLARLTTVQRLADENADCEDSRVLVAEAALGARLWGEARRHLSLAVAAAPPPGPSRRLCRLMARLEESEHNDAARAREWLDRATSAPPDPRYVCTRCGAEGATWHALCPNCGGFDTLAWQAGTAPLRAALSPSATPQTLLPAPTGLAPP
ncbi:MAG TPA: heme biosynthesis HemY N-terminal domain-containing protein [Stellaceae bacterium]|jgi:HemY protein